MKILFVGASGMIGGEALRHCLIHPKVTSVVAFVRRELPTEVSKNPKLKCIITKDFSSWPTEVLESHADAAGMIWAMGTYKGSIAADLDYPMLFIESMIRTLDMQNSSGSRRPFRYVHLSGKFVRQDQDKKLWFLEEPRKIKGLLETRALALGKEHSDVWTTFIVKPGKFQCYPFYNKQLCIHETWEEAVL
ncbi:hypothetical protein F5Y16DRAFT_361706 [Xylariaceae sp. FL0255]|nr:hypothetical protein F5Y16DRAFT_361706 [Xylariaceae sp. FL0255]